MSDVSASSADKVWVALLFKALHASKSPFLILKHVFLSHLDSKKEFLGGHGVSLARVLRQN